MISHAATTVGCVLAVFELLETEIGQWQLVSPEVGGTILVRAKGSTAPHR